MQSNSAVNSRSGRDGMRDGSLQGWRVGACERVRQLVTTMQERIAPLKSRILCVPQFFEAFDQGVEAALRMRAQHAAVAAPQQMMEAVDRFQPDLVLVLNGLHFFPEDHLDNIDRLRQRGFRCAVWFMDDPFLSDESARHAVHYDVVFTNERACVPLYESLGVPQVHYLPLAVHPELFLPLRADTEYAYDICFIGTGFQNRIRIFDEIAPFLQDKKVIIAGFNWQRLSSYPLLSQFIQDRWMPVAETVRYYNGAKIVINMHRAIDSELDNRNSGMWPAVSVNPRMFEISGCGAFQLSDDRDGLDDLYTIGSEIEVYRNADELMSKIDHYLHHEEARNRVAVRGYRRTIRCHTIAGRIGRLLALAGFQP